MVADGTAAESFEDWRRLQGITALTPFLAAEFATVRITSGAQPGPPLEDMIKRIPSPLLLVSAGRAEEYKFNVKYDRAAGSRPVEHWNLPDAGHTGAIRDAAPAYERRVTAFFDRALSRRPGRCQRRGRSARRSRRAPGARLVGEHRRAVLEHRRRDLPEPLDPVGAGEERAVADHHVVDQALVGVERLRRRRRRRRRS